MSRKLETSVYSLDGNSIWEVALKFERLGLQEINKFPETVFQGQDLNDSRAAFNYKMQFDKLFTLVKEFYVKVNGTQNMYNSINDELDEAFMKELYKQRNSKTVKTAKGKFMKEIETDLEGLKFQDSIDRIKNKMTKTLSSNDGGFLKYAKLEMVLDGLNAMYKFIEDNDGNQNVELVIATFEYENEGKIDDILQALKDSYDENSDELKKEIMLELKDKPELRNRLDIRSTLRLSRYEGSASNVLRDVLLTSIIMIQEINSKRVLLQESIRQDERIVTSIKEDNMLILDYLNELSGMEEVEKNYLESYNKVIDNMDKIDLFVKEL
jgi:hypothetical protein